MPIWEKAGRKLGPTARVVVALAVAGILHAGLSRVFFPIAAAPLLAFTAGLLGPVALIFVIAAFILEAVGADWAYTTFLCAFAAATLVLLVTGRLADRDSKLSDAAVRKAASWLSAASGLFLLLAFVRDVHWLDALALSAAYGAVSLAWARSRNLGWARLAKQGFVKTAVAAVLLVATIVLAELMARALYGTPKQIDIGNTRPHPTRVSTLTPGYTGEHRFGDGDRTVVVPFSYSSQGLRDNEIGPKKDGEIRIFMLGDSYTAGMTMPLEETIPKRLEAELRRRLGRQDITVINGGVSGYGPWQERDLLGEIGFPLEPDLVIHQVLPSNDIDNTLCRVGKFPEAYSTQWRRRFSYFLLRSNWQMKADRRLSETSQLYAMLSNITKRHYFVEALNHIRFIPPLDVPKLAPSAPRDPLIEINLREYYPVLQEGLEMMQADMRGIRDDCRERGVALMAFSVPVQQAVDTDWWHAAINGLDIYERDKDTRIIREICGRENIPFIEILSAIKSHPDIGSLYYNPDGHFTPAGAALVAESIADHLCAHYFTGCAD